MKLLDLFRFFVVMSIIVLMSSAPGLAETVRVTGSGASFPAPLYTTLFKEFGRANKNIRINYQAKGSGAGIRDLQNHTVDFAASDAAMTDEEMAKIKEGVQLLPMTAGEIVLAYNLNGVKGLKLTREAYAGIFLGKVKKWNDPVIAKSNPGVKLPDRDITVVARADSSGTTFVFTTHLSAVSEEFKNGLGIGKTINWPSAAKLVKAPKNDGVTATIKQTPGAVGYIEYGFAKMAKLEMAHLKNKTGKFIAPGLEAGQAALAHAVIPEDMRVWLPDPDGEESYPIVTYTWMLFYKKYKDPKKVEALHKMIEYCLTTGQKISDKAGYIPLPENVVEKVRAASKNIQ